MDFFGVLNQLTKSMFVAFSSPLNQLMKKTKIQQMQDSIESYSMAEKYEMQNSARTVAILTWRTNELASLEKKYLTSISKPNYPGLCFEWQRAKRKQTRWIQVAVLGHTLTKIIRFKIKILSSVNVLFFNGYSNTACVMGSRQQVKVDEFVFERPIVFKCMTTPTSR